MLEYILHTILFQFLFLLVYELFLKKETFFTYNRWSLLFTPVLSLILPLLEFSSLGNVIPADSVILLPEINLNQQTARGINNSLPSPKQLPGRSVPGGCFTEPESLSVCYCSSGNTDS